MSFGSVKRQNGLFVYDLPLLSNWHSETNLKHAKGKTYQYFGYNWWDLMDSKILQSSKYCGVGSIEFKGSDNCPGYMFVNCSTKDIRITNTYTKEVYLIGNYSTRLYNISKSNTLVSDYPDCLMQYVRVGDAILILIGLEQLLNGLSSISKSPLYKNLLLASGVINSDQYYATTGLNAYLSKIYREGNTIHTVEDESMMNWVQTLSDRWENINPAKKLPGGKSIPYKIHWIWLSRVPGTPNPLKKKYTKFMKSWILRNPNSEFFLWTDSSDPGVSKEIKDKVNIMYSDDINNLLDKLPEESKQGAIYMYKKHPNVGSRADTLRQCILYSIGGIYADVNDMLCMIPLETYLDKFDFMAGLEPMLYVNNAFVASAPKHPIVRNFLQFIAQNSKNFVDEWDPNLEKDEKDNLVVSQTGPIAFSGVIYGLVDEEYGQYLPRTCIFPSKFLYSNYEINDTPLSWLSPVSLCGHFDERAFLK